MLRKLVFAMFAFSAVFALPQPLNETVPRYDVPNKLRPRAQCKTPLDRFERHCHDVFKHRDVNPQDFKDVEGGVYTTLQQMCEKSPAAMSASENNRFEHGWSNGKRYAKYNFYIEWIEGCVTTQEKMDPKLPVLDNTELTCSRIIRKDYQECNNGGAGGYTDVGCLRYTFKPS